MVVNEPLSTYHTSMNRCVIIHGWEGYPEEGWFPWLRAELATRGFEVAVPAMTNSDKPQMVKWVQDLAHTVGTADPATYLVGHSLGCITILRYLEGLGPKIKIGGVVLVAGFANRLKYDEISHFFAAPVAWPTILLHCRKFEAIFSTNDPYVPLENSDTFSRQLNARITLLDNRGHFSGPGDNCTKLPEALQAVLRLANS